MSRQPTPRQPQCKVVPRINAAARLADDAAAYRALLATAEEVEAPAPAQALFSPVLSPSPAAPEAPVPANAPAPAEEEEDLDVLEAVSILVELSLIHI